jgi:hypothetical protein
MQLSLFPGTELCSCKLESKETYFSCCLIALDQLMNMICEKTLLIFYSFNDAPCSDPEYFCPLSYCTFTPIYKRYYEILDERQNAFFI